MTATCECRRIATVTHLANDTHPLLGASSLLGIVAGFGLLVPSALVPGLEALALPAFLILLPSLLYSLR
jgi:hypothetical protein